MAGRPSSPCCSSVAKAFHDEQDTHRPKHQALRQSLGHGRRPRRRRRARGSPFVDTSARRNSPKLCDPIDGGLRGAPKFPNPPIFSNFCGAPASRIGENSYRDARAADARPNVPRRHLRSSRRRLCPLFDRRAWLVPHFEKMLYDNAQIARTAAHSPGSRLAMRSFRARARDGRLAAARNDRRRRRLLRVARCRQRRRRGQILRLDLAEIVEELLGAEDAAILRANSTMSARIGNWAEEKHGKSVTILNRLEAEPRRRAEEEKRLAGLRQKLFARATSACIQASTTRSWPTGTA